MAGKYDDLILSADPDGWSRVVATEPNLKRQVTRANQLRAKNNLPPFDSPPRLKYSVDESYFETPEIQNSYWAGLIAADGCVYEKISPGAQSVINLELKDREPVEMFYNIIGGRFLEVVKPEGRNGFQYRWATSSDKIAGDLKKNYKILPKKSARERAPVDLDRRQSLAFIAGFIDGDGSYLVDKRTGYPSIQTLGSPEILAWINDILYDGHYKIHAHKTTHSLSSFGERAFSAQDEFLGIDVPLMQRKLDVWKGYK